MIFTRNSGKKSGIAHALKVVLGLCLIVAAIYYVLYGGDRPESGDETPTESVTVTATVPQSEIPEKVFYGYFYEDLSEKEQQAYRAIFDEIYSFPSAIKIPDGDVFDGSSAVLYALMYDHPDIFFLSKDLGSVVEIFGSYFKPEYSITKYDYMQYMKELNKITDAVLNEAEKCSSDYEKELLIHDYIAAHCKYDNSLPDNNGSSMYYCLVKGRAACAGYAKAFMYLLNKTGIDGRVVLGDAETVASKESPNHAWNYVVLDGKGYHTDVTWDDSSADPGNSHAYFNITTKEITKDHTVINPSDLPECSAKTYNYFIHEASYFTTVSGDAFLAQVKKAVKSAHDRGYTRAELKFSSAALLKSASALLSRNNNAEKIFSDLGVSDNTTVRIKTADKKLVLYLYF